MSCFNTGTSRAIRGRHEEGCGGQDCPGCLPCPEDHCQHCKRSHAEVTCAACVHMARTNLASLALLSTHLPEESTEGSRSVGSRDFPGGDALVLLGPSAARADLDAVYAYRYQAGLSIDHRSDEYPTDLRPVAGVLARWEAAWREELNQPTGLTSTLSRSVDYLMAHLHQAAGRPTFTLFITDIAENLRRLEDVLYDGERPERTRVPCWECGVRLVHIYGSTEDDDHWVCPACGERYDRGRYDRAKHDHLASVGAERYVSVTDAAAAVGRPVQTVRTWIRRGLVSTQRNPVSGRTQAWWPHIRLLHLARKHGGH
jgi:hypothetical protein